MTEHSIDHLFTYHDTDDPQIIERYRRVNEAAKVFAREIHDCCPNVIERLTAIHRVQEARMWANASVALNQDWLIAKHKESP